MMASKPFFHYRSSGNIQRHYNASKFLTFARRRANNYLAFELHQSSGKIVPVSEVGLNEEERISQKNYFSRVPGQWLK